MGSVTPPVALSAFAAVCLSAAGSIIPLVFVYHHDILLNTGTTTVTGVVWGCGAFAVSTWGLRMATIAPGSSAYLAMTTMATLVNRHRHAPVAQADHYAVQDGGMRLHPGALRYYEEVGVDIPEATR